MALKNEKKENSVINIILTPLSPNHRPKDKKTAAGKENTTQTTIENWTQLLSRYKKKEETI